GVNRLEQWRASLRYYAERPVAKLSSPEDVVSFMSADRPVYMVMLRRDYRELRRGRLGTREVVKGRGGVGPVKTRTGPGRRQDGGRIFRTRPPSRAAARHPA